MNARADIDIEKASKMWNDGQSAGMIADQFGISRNVVIGLANRNRDLFPNKTGDEPIKRKQYKTATDIDVAKAAQLWKDGYSQGYIAAMLESSLMAIRRLVGKNRELFPKREHSEAWTEEAIAEAAKMWAEGCTAPMIAEALNTSRAAVLGLSYRERERFPHRNKAGHKKARNCKPMPTMVPKRRVVEAEDFGETVPLIPPTEYDNSRLPYAKTLLDLEPCECKWALTAAGPHLFCAETTESRASYCTNHLERSLPRPEHRRLKAAA